MVPNRATHHKFQNLKMGERTYTESKSYPHNKIEGDIFKKIQCFFKIKYDEVSDVILCHFYEGAVGLAKVLSHPVCKSRNLEMGDRTILHLLFAGYTGKRSRHEALTC